MKTVREYNVHIDSRKRVTLRGAKYDYYNVREFENGCFILEPRALEVPRDMSARTLRELDEAVRSFHMGKASDPSDLSDF
ncbi:MAG: hypothetical protein ACOX6J_03155 [Oscillospiraceae bacterium]